MSTQYQRYQSPNHFWRLQWYPPPEKYLSSKNSYSALRKLRRTFPGRINLLTGCFDLKIHQGHDIQIAQARGYVPGGLVVVGVNSDRSVKQLKGPNRPHDNQEVRLQRILDHPYIDYGFILEDLDATKALHALVPDVYTTFLENKPNGRTNLYDKPEIIRIAEEMPDTVIRINVDYATDHAGARISTSAMLLALALSQ